MTTVPARPPVQRALVLAAGKGTRIRKVAPDRPKPLIKLAGKTVLERNLLQLATAGVREVWINLHHQGEQIAALIGDGERYGLQVHFSWETDLLGTAGAAKKLEHVLAGDTFLVVYGDNLTAIDLHEMVAYHHQHGASATIAVFDRDRVPNTGLAGGRVVLGKGGRVFRFEEASTSNSPYVNAGVYALEPSVLAIIPPGVFCDFGRDVFPTLIDQGARVQAYPITSYCLGIDTPEALARAEALIHDLDCHEVIGSR